MPPTCENCRDWHRLQKPAGYGVCGMTGQLMPPSPGPFSPALIAGDGELVPRQDHGCRGFRARETDGWCETHQAAYEHETHDGKDYHLVYEDGILWTCWQGRTTMHAIRPVGPFEN